MSISEVDLYGTSLIEIICRSMQIPAALLAPENANYASAWPADAALREWLLRQTSEPAPPEPAVPIELDELKQLLGGDGATMTPARFTAEGGFSLS